MRTSSRPWLRSPVSLLIAGVVALAACGGSGDRTLSGMVRTPTPTIDVAGISDASGAALDLHTPSNGLSLVYFGYTLCPDVCPTTLADLRAAYRGLDAAQLARLHLTFVTIDPERDTEATLNAYVNSFIDGSDGIRITDDAQLRALADAFGASYSREVAADGTIEVGHTAFLYALDSSGQLVVSWPFGTSSNEIRADLETLLARTA